MVSLVTLFWKICTLRAGPESVPARVWFAVVLLIADIAVALLHHRLTLSEDPEALTLLQALGVGLVNIAIIAAVTRSALSIRKLDERFLATLTALIGTDLMISVLIVVASELSKLMGVSPVIATFLLQAWGIVVWGFIYQRAFNTTLMFGIVIAFGVGIFALFVSLAAVGVLK